MLKRVFSIIVLSWALVFPIWAQEAGPAIRLSLKEAVIKAIQFAPQLEVARLASLEREAKQQQAKSLAILPSFRARVIGGPVPDVPDGSGPENNFPEVDSSYWNLGPFMQLSVELLQPIFTFNRIHHLRSAASHGVRAAQLNQQAVQNEVVAKVKQAYWAIAFLYSLQDFLVELTDRIEAAQRQVEKRITDGSGDATDIDLMRIAVFRSDTDRRMIELINGIDLAHQTLKILTGIGMDERIELVENKFVLQNAEVRPFDYYWGRAKVARPEIFEIEAGVQAQRGLMMARKASFYPNVFFAGGFRYGVAPGRQQVGNPFLSDDFNYRGLGGFFGMEQNLSFASMLADFREERGKFERVQAQQKMAMQGIELELRKSYAEWVGKYKSYESAEQAFKSGRSWVLATTLNFGAGLVPVKELLEAFVAYSKVKFSFLETINDCNQSLAEMSRVVGEEIGNLEY